MTHFLLVYDRAAGELLRQERFESGEDALKARFAAEAAFAARSGIEIVAISANSEADLRRTHGRYFLSPAELAKRLAAAGPQSAPV